MATLQTPLVELVGRTAAPLAKSLDLHTVGDLLHHYPRRLAERGELTAISSLREGEQVTVLAQVVTAKALKNRSGSGSRCQVVVSDGRGQLELVFFAKQFGRAQWRADRLAAGTRALFAGTVQWRGNRPQLMHPECLELTDDEDGAEFAGALIPIYPSSKQVQTWHVSNAVRIVLDQLDPLPDPVPAQIRARHGLPDYDSALRDLHRPPDRASWNRARHRLAWDEALGIQLALAGRKAAAAANPALARPARAGGLLERFDARLPFRLTGGQRQVGAEISAELAGTIPMQRLLQGEVGSGKTVVALRAMLQVVDAGGQAALLAPTEVLAAQHARSIEAMLGELGQAGYLGGAPDGTRVALLTGSLSAAARRAALSDAAGGAAGIVVGTHALIQDRVQFADLGLVVVDEQHRFGVEQRDALRSRSERPPHLLVMTATPIPRTVAMTVFGDLDISTLRELPQGRSAIATSVVPTAEKPTWLDRAWQRIREEVAQGRQAFVVCPRIGGTDSEQDATGPEEAAGPDDAAGPDAPAGPDDRERRPPVAVEDVFALLEQGPLAGLRLAQLHGGLPAEDKDRVMTAFAAGELDVLVATTVIEVGVDVPNATVMVVLDADRFGISQLHQLRGRVGRGAHPGLCLLVTDSPPGSPARGRLDGVASTTDGFALARLDLEQRREGDVLGVAQSGRRSQLRLLSLLRDEDLIAAAREEAVALVAADPGLARHPLLARQVAALVDDERAEYLEKA